MGELKVEDEISNAVISFIQKGKNVLYFNYSVVGSELLLLKILQEPELKAEIEKLDPVTLEGWYKSNEELEKLGKNVDDFRNEFRYRIYVQIFEEFLFDMFSILLSKYPVFLRRETFDLDFESIFEESDIEYVRRKIINRRVKKYIQSSNIKTILSKFKSVFGIDLKIGKDDLDMLIFSSKIRNVLTHNNGLINDFFISELKTEGVKSPYKIGDSVVKEMESELDKIKDLHLRLTDNISQQIIRDLHRVEQYSKSF